MIVNVVCFVYKCTNELQVVYATQIAQLVANVEVQTQRGVNQIDTLQRHGDT